MTMDELGKTLFSLGVWGGGLVTMGAGALATAALSPVWPFEQSYPYLVRPAMAACTSLTLASFDVTYHPDFDPTRPSVFAMNHVNILDGQLACRVIPSAFCGVFNRWHFHVPAYGWIMRVSHGIAVPPEEGGRSRLITEAARQRFEEEGLSILVFPEAHRTLDGCIGPFKRGVFFMARDIGAPVVPLVSRGWRDVGRKGSWRFEPGKRVEVWVGPQLETRGLDEVGVTELTSRVRDMMVGFVSEDAASEAHAR